MEEYKSARSVIVNSETPVEILKRVGIHTPKDSHPETPFCTSIGLLSTGCCPCLQTGVERYDGYTEHNHDDVGVGTFVAALIASSVPDELQPVVNPELLFLGGWCYRWNVHHRVKLYSRKIMSADNMTLGNLVPGLLWAEEAKCDIICIPHTGQIDVTARKLLEKLGRSGVLTIVAAQSLEAALEKPDTLASFVGKIPGLVAVGGFLDNGTHAELYASPAYILPVEGVVSGLITSSREWRMRRSCDGYSACGMLTALAGLLRCAGCGDRVKQLLPLIVQRLSPGAKCNPVFHFTATDDARWLSHIRAMRDPVWVYPQCDEFVNQPLRLYCAPRPVALSVVRLDLETVDRLEFVKICTDRQLIGKFLMHSISRDWPEKLCFTFRRYLESQIGLRAVDACECAVACQELFEHAFPDISDYGTKFYPTWEPVQRAGEVLAFGFPAEEESEPVKDVLRRLEFSADDRKVTHSFLNFKKRASRDTWHNHVIREPTLESNVHVHTACVVPVTEHGLEAIPFAVVELQCSDDGRLVYCFCCKTLAESSGFPLGPCVAEVGSVQATVWEYPFLRAITIV